jgi:hypothetical protein
MWRAVYPRKYKTEDKMANRRDGYWAEYYHRNRAKKLAYGKQQRANGITAWQRASPAAKANQAKKLRLYRLRLKIRVIHHYTSGACCCACCGEPDIRFLQLDHINGNGNKHRRSLGKGRTAASHVLYRKLVADDFPLGYQALCANCNQARSTYGVCPHQKPLDADPARLDLQALIVAYSSVILGG